MLQQGPDGFGTTTVFSFPLEGTGGESLCPCFVSKENLRRESRESI